MYFCSTNNYPNLRLNHSFCHHHLGKAMATSSAGHASTTPAGSLVFLCSTLSFPVSGPHPYMTAGAKGMSHVPSTGGRKPLASPSLRRPVSFTPGPGLYPHSDELCCPSLLLAKKGDSGKDVKGIRASLFLGNNS